MNSVMTGLDSIPETAIAVSVYLLGSAIILWCWYEIAKRLPNPLGGITWICCLQFYLPQQYQKAAMQHLPQPSLDFFLVF